nr:uncharacterized protein LOC106678814 isoform X3 [Halyomorpha halys]
MEIEKRYKKAKSENEKTANFCNSNEISWPMKEVNIVFSYFSSLYTFLAFCTACSLVPWISVTYLMMRGMRHSWIRWLEGKYPGLEFIVKTTARTAVDTPRNQGLICLLLSVQGNCQIQLIKNRVKEDILERRKGGQLVFPHLRARLTSRWGNYAWMKGSEKEFCLDDHILLAPTTFKGRPISNLNIQDMTSDLIAKMLPGEIPPWQISVITGIDKSYLLVRLHHLYMSEEGLSLADILSIKQTTWESSPVLDGVFRPPVVIPRVYAALSESTSNMWNEILAQYDPAVKPEVLKHPTLRSTFYLALIVIISTIKSSLSSSTVSLTETFKTELYKRSFTLSLISNSIYNILSLNTVLEMILMFFKLPLEAIKLPIRTMNIVFDTPKHLLNLTISLFPDASSTTDVKEIYLYWLYLAHYVLQELVYLFKVFYQAPRVLFEELFLPETPANVHQLQTLSVCGRKVVSWSEPIPKDVIKQIAYASGSTESEIMLSALAASLRGYFEEAGFSLPDSVMTTCHFTKKGEIPGPGSGGFLCLPLPLRASNINESLEEMKKSLFRSKKSQTVFYLASERGLDSSLLIGLLPTLFAKAALYMLSRRYAVSVSLVEGTPDCTLLWGQHVDELMYWRPAQANVCLSITLICYSDSVTLGVMADAQLSPHHSDLPAYFPKYLRNLASSHGIPFPGPSQPQ